MQGLGDTRYRHLFSDRVGRGFHIYVSLPEGYEESNDAYPALYVLDGGELFPMLVSYQRYLVSGKDIPPMIVIGISYGTDDFESGNFRSTDYTAPTTEREFWGGAENFRKFLSDELIPLIETDYRSRVDRRIVFGHSLGGQFVLYAAQTAPDLFWGAISSNPALHRNLEFFLQADPGVSVRRKPMLFVGNATNDDARFLEPRARWVAEWSSRGEKPWLLRVEDLEGHSHMSAPPAAYLQGMRWLFAAE